MARIPRPNESAIVAPSDALKLAHAADYAISFAIAIINAHPKALRALERTTPDETVRHLAHTHTMLYDALKPFRDTCGRVADGLIVRGDDARAVLDRDA